MLNLTRTFMLKPSYEFVPSEKKTAQVLFLWSRYNFTIERKYYIYTPITNRCIKSNIAMQSPQANTGRCTEDFCDFQHGTVMVWPALHGSTLCATIVKWKHLRAMTAQPWNCKTPKFTGQGCQVLKTVVAIFCCITYYRALNKTSAQELCLRSFLKRVFTAEWPDYWVERQTSAGVM